MSLAPFSNTSLRSLLVHVVQMFKPVVSVVFFCVPLLYTSDPRIPV